RPMISGAERITHIRHAIDVVEQLSDYCTPRACTRKSVVGGHIEAPREPMTHEQRNAIIARPVIRSENRDVRRGTAVGVEQSHSADIFIAAILVYSLLVLVLDRSRPVAPELMFDGNTGLNRVGRVVMRVDNGALIAGAEQSRRKRVNCSESVDPPVLRQIVVVHADSSAEYRVTRISWRVRNAQTRSYPATVIVRNGRRQRNPI